MIRRIFILLAALAFVVAACGGDDETTTEAPGDGGSDQPTATEGTQPIGTPVPADTAAPGTPPPSVVSTGDFCADSEANDALIDGIDFFSDDIEAAADQWLSAIAAAEAAAPPEIAADVAVIAAGARNFVDLLGEANFNPLEVDPTDPRLAALEDGTLDQAADNIAAYCGFEIETGDLGGSGSGVARSVVFGTSVPV